MISKNELRQFLDLRADDDLQVSALRLAVIEAFEATTGGLWNARTWHVEERELATDRISTVFTRLRPITSMTTVEHRRRSETTFAELLASANAFFVVGDNRVQVTSGYFRPIVRLTYDGGWTDLTSPADVRMALKIQAQFILKRHSGDKAITTSQGLEGATTSFMAASLHPEFKRVTKLYRRLT